MKFIIEEDLRDLYKNDPFTMYQVEANSKLTPGARQFLLDRGIPIFTSELRSQKNQAEKKNNPIPEDKKKWGAKKLIYKLRAVEAIFFLTAEEVLQEDIYLAEKILVIRKQISAICDAIEGKLSPAKLECLECRGIHADNFYEDMGDCIEVTELHMQLQRGKEILQLNQLKCNLREIEPMIFEVYEYNEIEEELYEALIDQIHSLVNRLSQLICIEIGGKECRKNVQT